MENDGLFHGDNNTISIYLSADFKRIYIRITIVNANAKKITLSGAVIIAFVLYSWHARREAGLMAVDAPVALPRAPTPSSAASTTPVAPSAPVRPGYRNGTYTGSVEDAFYGNIQVRATISGGRLTDVVFLQYPNDRPESLRISRESMPPLKQEAIQVQSAQVDVVSGATDTSQAFTRSLGAALNKAKG
jgi:uncharacterized protein with FMN-binding domain